MSKNRLRCDYCHSDSHTLNTNAECRAKYDTFEAFGNKYQYVFLALLIIEMVLFCVLAFFMDPWASMGILFVAMGVTIFVFPFCTPQTFEMMGVKGTVKLARVLGVILIIAGLILIAVPYVL
jgi:hypothetical protein